ncbi:hypothetical protein OG912_01415 [Streptomyces sp. NBC_00464]|uniref:hypothetical protein n=1 Tax=Streptomyces sp. NBC_00464 TaxID=2975751 RepID=UPI002E198693
MVAVPAVRSLCRPSSNHTPRSQGQQPCACVPLSHFPRSRSSRSSAWPARPRDGDGGNGNGDGTTATQTISDNTVSDSAFLGHVFQAGNTGIQQTPVTITFAEIGD